MGQTATVGMWDRLLIRGLREYIPEGSSVVAVEVGTSNAMGPQHKVTAVLTTDALLLASPVRAKTVLTKITRADIRSVEDVEPCVVNIGFDDFDRAAHRVINLDLKRRGDAHGIIEQLRASCHEPPA